MVLIVAALGPFAVIVGGLGLYLGYEWVTHGRYLKNVSAVANDERMYPAGGRLCKDENKPVYVGFANQSARTVDHIEILVEARLPGSAGNILEYPSKASFDRGVHPGETFGACYNFPVRNNLLREGDSSQPVYKAIIVSVLFGD